MANAPTPQHKEQPKHDDDAHHQGAQQQAREPDPQKIREERAAEAKKIFDENEKDAGGRLHSRNDLSDWTSLFDRPKWSASGRRRGWKRKSAAFVSARAIRPPSRAKSTEWRQHSDRADGRRLRFGWLRHR